MLKYINLKYFAQPPFIQQYIKEKVHNIYYDPLKYSE
jgi:hypothetical protein